MGMFTKPILDLIARRPGVRMIEIADAVDCDVDMVEKSIMAEITAGVIIVEEVKKPNGHPTNSYRYAKPVALLAPEPEIKIPDTPLAAAAAAPAELPAFLEKKEKTKTQLGIDCIVANGGKATMAQLHEALGLRKEQSVTPFMNHPLIKGLVARDGRDWILGPNYPGNKTEFAAKPHQQETQPPIVPVEPPLADEELEEVVEEEVEQAANVEETEPVFACALWSDGDLQMVRDGETVIMLNAHETKILCEYLDRTLTGEVTA